MALIILTDVRLNVLGESHGDHLKAISIAISRLVYGIDGLAGLEHVLNVLKEIPSISVLKLENLVDYERYNDLINLKILEARSIGSVNINDLHGYLNDQSYLYYTIAAFSLFGIKIESLAYLWLAVFFLSVYIYIFEYRKNIFSLLLISIFLISIAVIIIANPGVGDQLITIHNFRFTPVLGMIPLLYALVSITDKERGVFGWIGLTIQLLVLVLVMSIRGSAQWMMIALFVFSVCYFFFLKRSSVLDRNAVIKKKRFMFSPLLLTLLFFLSINTLNSKILHEEYNKDIWSTVHGMWHPLVIGLTVDPVLFNKYVCTDKPLEDNLKGFRPLICKEENKNYTQSRLYYWVFSQPSDMHGFHAAVRHLRESGSPENIGSSVKSSEHFNLNWKSYDQVLEQVYFKIILNDPIDSLYMYAIAKPLKYIKESFFYAKYFLKSIIESKNTFILILVAIVPFLYFFSLMIFKKQIANEENSKGEPGGLFYSMFFMIFVSSLVPSIVFYSQSHTIADSVVALLALFLFLPFLFFHVKESFNRKKQLEIPCE